MLFKIGDAEMTVGELTLRGCYLGSNVSYNVKKMVENEYLVHERSVHDRRSVHVRLTERGIKLRDRLTAMHSRHAEMPVLGPRLPVIVDAGGRDIGVAEPLLDLGRSHRLPCRARPCTIETSDTGTSAHARL